MPWNLSLEFLTILSISGIERDHLRIILAGCPVLQDLEYHCKDTGFDLDILSPEEDLSVVKGTLRRLCYSIAPKDFLKEIDILDEDYYPSWTALPVLKTLEIQRMLIYGPVEEYIYEAGQQPPADDEAFKMELTTPEDFMSRLPQTLVTLCIGRIVCWPAMYRDAVALAEAAPYRFPQLRNLHLEMNYAYRSLDGMADLVSIFAKARITCTVVPRRYTWDDLLFTASSLDSSAQINLVESPDCLEA
jgi:hypothetical protein